MRLMTLVLVLLAGCASNPSPESDRFVPLFNGRDLSGWVRVNCAPETFRAENGIIVSTGKPTGVLRSDRMYENYIIELDWMHLKKGGNAGLFIHSGPMPVRTQPFTKGHEIQILDGDSPDGIWTGHGDIFSIHGASFVPDRPHPKGWMRCLPIERRSNPFGQWNHYRVVVNDGTVKLEVNGKEVSGGTKLNPRKGYICLESEGSECHFKNLRIKELPSTNAPAEETAEADAGFKSLYTGLDLRGWKADSGVEAHWKPKDWILDYDGKGSGTLTSVELSGKVLLSLDWRSPAKDAVLAPSIRLKDGREIPLKLPQKAGDWVRSQIETEGGAFSIVAPGPLQFANIFIKDLAK